MNILVICQNINEKALNTIEDKNNNQLFYLEKKDLNYKNLKNLLKVYEIDIILSFQKNSLLKIWTYILKIPLFYYEKNLDIEKELQREIAYYQKKDIPVLMYHRIINKKEDLGIYDTSVSVENFEEQMKYLKENNYISLTFENLENGKYKNRFDKNKKYVMITFDDGYKDNLENALPILKKYNIKITLFLVTDETYNKWDIEVANREREKRFELMNESELKEFIKSGLVEIGGHTTTHLDMPTLDSEILKKDLKIANEKIESLTNKKVISFAYPWGRSDKRVRGIIKESGYQFAVSTESGSPCFSDDLYEIVRVGIYSDDNMEKFKKKLSGSYPFMREKRDQRKKFRNKLRKFIGLRTK